MGHRLSPVRASLNRPVPSASSGGPGEGNKTAQFCLKQVDARLNTGTHNLSPPPPRPELLCPPLFPVVPRTLGLLGRFPKLAWRLRRISQKTLSLGLNPRGRGHIVLMAWEPSPASCLYPELRLTSEQRGVCGWSRVATGQLSGSGFHAADTTELTTSWVFPFRKLYTDLSLLLAPQFHLHQVSKNHGDSPWGPVSARRQGELLFYINFGYWQFYMHV